MLQDINRIENNADSEGHLIDVADSRNEFSIPATSAEEVTPFPVPTANSEGEFESNHIKVTLQDVEGIFYFWQSEGVLYYSYDGTWNNELTVENGPGNGSIKIELREEKPWIVGELEVEEG